MRHDGTFTKQVASVIKEFIHDANELDESKQKHKKTFLTLNKLAVLQQKTKPDVENKITTLITNFDSRY